MLWCAFRKRAVIDTLLGVVVLGLAIFFMHHSAMESRQFIQLRGLTETKELRISEDYRGLSIVVTMFFVCGACLIVCSILNHRGHRRARVS